MSPITKNNARLEKIKEFWNLRLRVFDGAEWYHTIPEQTISDLASVCVEWCVKYQKPPKGLKKAVAKLLKQ